MGRWRLDSSVLAQPPEQVGDLVRAGQVEPCCGPGRHRVGHDDAGTVHTHCPESVLISRVVPDEEDGRTRHIHQCFNQEAKRFSLVPRHRRSNLEDLLAFGDPQSRQVTARLENEAPDGIRFRGIGHQTVVHTEAEGLVLDDDATRAC